VSSDDRIKPTQDSLGSKHSDQSLDSETSFSHTGRVGVWHDRNGYKMSFQANVGLNQTEAPSAPTTTPTPAAESAAPPIVDSIPTADAATPDSRPKFADRLFRLLRGRSRPRGA
jgi:hypothetical protein